MTKDVSHSWLVIKQPKTRLSLPSKIYAGLFILVLTGLIGILAIPQVTIAFQPLHLSKQTLPMTRLPLLIDRVVWDSSAYVYVKHASIRAELGIPWGRTIGQQEQ